MMDRRLWWKRGLALALAVFACQQLWRHGHDYVFADRFAAVESGKVYRGAWQKPWPMRRLVRDHKIKTVVALAHPPDHPMVAREQALARELGVRWVHVPIVDQRSIGDKQTISDRLEEAAAIVADPKNQPVYFHCHHGINRASMVQIAYRTKYCGWTLEQATEEDLADLRPRRGLARPRLPAHAIVLRRARPALPPERATPTTAAKAVSSSRTQYYALLRRSTAKTTCRHPGAGGCRAGYGSFLPAPEHSRAVPSPTRA